mmetsp:Transcript_8126/g.36573  ORF Transcript_8126/g.36573 Transcript_8126/m.36573 type:complete len:284 (-) Transcript_8126:234-1085(-)
MFPTADAACASNAATDSVLSSMAPACRASTSADTVPSVDTTLAATAGTRVSSATAAAAGSAPSMSPSAPSTSPPRPSMSAPPPSVPAFLAPRSSSVKPARTPSAVHTALAHRTARDSSRETVAPLSTAPNAPAAATRAARADSRSTLSSPPVASSAASEAMAPSVSSTCHAPSPSARHALHSALAAEIRSTGPRPGPPRHMRARPKIARGSANAVGAGATEQIAANTSAATTRTPSAPALDLCQAASLMDDSLVGGDTLVSRVSRFGTSSSPYVTFLGVLADS